MPGAKGMRRRTQGMAGGAESSGWRDRIKLGLRQLAKVGASLSAPSSATADTATTTTATTTTTLTTTAT